MSDQAAAPTLPRVVLGWHDDRSQISGTKSTEGKRTICVCIFLVVAVFAVFGQTVKFHFLNYDDQFYVYENDAVMRGLSFNNVVWAFTHRMCGFYHPLTALSLMLDHSIYGLHPGGYHLDNVLIHAASAVLLFLVLRTMTGAFWRSAFVAAAFAVHPLRVESVAWVSDRKDVLATFFALVAIAAYVRYVRKPSRVRYCGVLAAYILKLLCKPTGITLPFILLLLDYWPLGRFVPAFPGVPAPPERGWDLKIALRLILEKVPLLVVAVGAALIGYSAEKAGVRSEIPLLMRLGHSLVSYAVYLRQTVWPAGLAAFYPYPDKPHPAWEVGSAFLLLAGISAAALASARKRPWIVVGWFWFLGMLVPVIGVIQLLDFGHADRYTYLPQIGLLVLATWTAFDVLKNRGLGNRVIGSVSSVVLVALAGCAYVQTTYWRDSETLWTRTLSCTPPSTFVLSSLGLTFFDEGRVADSITQYEKALAINPNYAEARNNLGAALFTKGDRDQALIQYEKALELKPNYSEARNNIGFALQQRGDLAGAIEQYQKVLQIDPTYENAQFNLGVALFLKGDGDGAIAPFQCALAIRPDDVAARNYLGAALMRRGRIDEAIASYREALKVDPQSVDACNNLGVALFQKGETNAAMSAWRESLILMPRQPDVLNNLAWMLATTADASASNHAEAVVMAERARSLAGADSPAILHTLAAAYAATGRYEDATATARQALQLVTAQKNDRLAAMLENEIKSYEDRKPIGK